MNNFVGNSHIKEEITNIFKTIIFEYNIYKSKPSMGMSNIMISGDPGVGKTTLAVHISKLLYFYGFSNFFTTKEKIDIGEISLESINKLKKNILLHNMSEKINNISKSLELTTQNAQIRSIKSEMINLKDDYEELKKLESSLNVSLKEKPNINIVNRKKSDDIICIFTPADFIAGYVGQTTIKTRELLEKNRNKIIIIDEAYGFATSENNWFGKEALIEINTYMSEYPNEYLFIFCGYKDLLTKNILELQPGIDRRIKYKFELEKYNKSELMDIFLLKSKNLGILPKKELLLNSFHNINFKNNAGDIEIIVSKLRNKIACYYWDKEFDKIEINIEWIENILEKYKNNYEYFLNHLYC